ncbi:hypothetical protein BH11ARM2_BH11ARM2_01000 [soil metagenome]
MSIRFHSLALRCLPLLAAAAFLPSMASAQALTSFTGHLGMDGSPQSGVVGGSTQTIKFDLTFASPTISVRKINLTANSKLGLPTQFTVPMGVTTYTYTAPANHTSVLSLRMYTVAAKYQGVVFTTINFNLKPFQGALVLAPHKLVAGGTSTGTLRLNAIPRSEMSFNLSSSNSQVTVPSSLTIFGGAQSAVFSINTTVAASGSVTIGAKVGSETVTKILKVTP